METKNVLLALCARAIPGKRFTELDTNISYSFGHLHDASDYYEGILHINDYKTIYRLLESDGKPMMVLADMEYPIMGINAEPLYRGGALLENVRFIVGNIEKNKSFALYP